VRLAKQPIVKKDLTPLSQIFIKTATIDSNLASGCALEEN
jgi:hypothetical protein